MWQEYLFTRDTKENKADLKAGLFEMMKKRARRTMKTGNAKFWKDFAFFLEDPERGNNPRKSWLLEIHGNRCGHWEEPKFTREQIAQMWMDKTGEDYDLSQISRDCRSRGIKLIDFRPKANRTRNKI